MMKLWSRWFGEKTVLNKESNLPDANVETTSDLQREYNDYGHLNLESKMSIDDLPTEILFLIFDRLDRAALFRCFFVCKRWRSIIFSIAHTGKGNNMMWCFLYKQYLMEGYYKQNSNSNCKLPFQQIIESSLNWNYKCSLSLSISVPVIDAVQMTVYRENIIVVTSQGVKYYDKKTFEVKKTICLDNCYDFIENDYMVARSIKYDNDEAGKGYKLQLFGKCSLDDNAWESQITGEIPEISTTQELNVRLFKIEENHCFVILKSNNTLYSYNWRYAKIPIEWRVRYRCRYYGGMGEIIAMYLGISQIHFLTSSGALLCYQRRRGGVITKVYTFSEVMQSGFVQLVQRSNLILNVPDDCPGRIMRIKELGFPILYRLETPKLTCVTEHGHILFLGFSDGKVKIMRPMDFSRGKIFKHYTDLSIFERGPPSPVVSIVIHVDKGKQCIFVATTSCVYRLTPTFPDAKNLWEKENIIGLICPPRVELISI